MEITNEDIQNYVRNSLGDLNLNENDERKYIKFIQKYNNYAGTRKEKFCTDCFEYFQNNFENLYALFTQEGYSSEESLELAKKAVVFSDRKELYKNIMLARALNMEKEVILNQVICFRKRIEASFAKKMYLMDQNDYKNQNANIIFRSTDNQFEKRFNTNMTNLINKYPLNDETLRIILYQANLTESQLKQEFKLTREEMAIIFPTTKNELSTIKTIASFTDEYIKSAYGITRSELLKKHPLNNDTLMALRSINTSSDKAVIKTFNQSKDEVLHFRTISTAIIKAAMENRKIVFQQSKKQKEQIQYIKKGAIQNG